MSRRGRGVTQEVAAWRERTAAGSNRPRRMVLSDLGLLALSQRPPRNATAAPHPGVDGRHLAQGRAAEILGGGRARARIWSPERIRMPSEGRDAQAPAAAVAVCSGVVRQIADDLDFDQGLLATRADPRNFSAASPVGSTAGGGAPSSATRSAASSPARSRPPQPARPSGPRGALPASLADIERSRPAQ